jgi:hypothetical protein
VSQHSVHNYYTCANDLGGILPQSGHAVGLSSIISSLSFEDERSIVDDNGVDAVHNHAPVPTFCMRVHDEYKIGASI